MSDMAMFIGRENELRQLTELLSRQQLISIVGLGGMGKTHLAFEIASRVSEKFSDGAYIVTESRDWASAIAAQIGFHFYEGETSPQTQLLNYLADKQLLLVLDNFEDSIEEWVGFLVQIVARAPRVHLLVTSRERLQLSIETVFPLEGMTDSAEQLFIEYARRMSPTFEPVPEIHTLCTLVGGMPLAIMLAAAWVDVLSVAEIAAELQFSLLQTNWRDVPLRQQKIEAVFDYAWSRIKDVEQTALRRCAVFRGSFTREAAGVVAGASHQILASLIQKSLVSCNGQRYWLHPLVRQYAEQQLHEAGELENSTAAHINYFVEFLYQRDALMKGQHQLTTLSEIEADFENILRIAHVPAARQPLFTYLDLQNRWSEGESLFDGEAWQAVVRRIHFSLMRSPALAPIKKQIEACLIAAQQDEDAVEIALCYRVYGRILSAMGEHQRAIDCFQQSLTIALTMNDFYEVLQSYHLLGYAHVGLNQVEQFLLHTEQALAICREHEEKINASAAMLNSGSALMWLGRYEEAQIYFEEVIAFGEARNDWTRILWGKQCLGSLAFHLGKFEEVRRLAHEVVTMADYYHYEEGKALGNSNLIQVALAEENYEEAKQRLTQFPTLSLMERLIGLSVVALGIGEFATARRLVEQVLRQGNEREKVQILRSAAYLLAQDNEIERAAMFLSRAWHDSPRHAMMIERLPIFRNLHLQLSPFSSAWERGKLLDLADVSLKVKQKVKLVESLSNRELEILSLVAQGLSNQTIADYLVISITTVKKHLTHIFAKLAVTSRTQALVRAQELQILP